MGGKVRLGVRLVIRDCDVRVLFAFWHKMEHLVAFFVPFCCGGAGVLAFRVFHRRVAGAHRSLSLPARLGVERTVEDFDVGWVVGRAGWLGCCRRGCRRLDWGFCGPGARLFTRAALSRGEEGPAAGNPADLKPEVIATVVKELFERSKCWGPLTGLRLESSMGGEFFGGGRRRRGGRLLWGWGERNFRGL